MLTAPAAIRLRCVNESPEAVVSTASLQAVLSQAGHTVATAESLTGGGLGSLLSQAAGASETYLGGVVAYATSVKHGLLGVSDQTLAEHGAVSAECAAEMASGVRVLLDADYAVSTTGVAGPDTQEGKPVGTVFVGVAGPDGTSVKELHLDGDRAEIRARACREAVNAALAVVGDWPGGGSG